jgi:hypothetical protein
MATRENALRLSPKELLAIAGELGTSARVFDDYEVRQLLRAAVEREGTQVAFAKRRRLDRTHLNQVLKGKGRIGRSVLKCLGLRKAYMIDQAENPEGATDSLSLAPTLEPFDS